MKCPNCGGGPVRVICTEHRGQKTRRFKTCSACKHAFRTTELLDNKGRYYPLQQGCIQLKLSDEQVAELRELRSKEKLTYAQLAVMFDISLGHAKRLCLHKRRRNVA